MTPTTSGATPSLPTGTTLTDGTYLLTSYTMYPTPVDGCDTVLPVASTFTIDPAPTTKNAGSIKIDTVLSDGTSSTFNANISTQTDVMGMANAVVLTDTCPDTLGYMISWGSYLSTANGQLVLDFESATASPVTPLQTGCTAIAEYTL